MRTVTFILAYTFAWQIGEGLDGTDLQWSVPFYVVALAAVYPFMRWWTKRWDNAPR